MLRKIIPLGLVLAIGAFTYAGTSMDVADVGAMETATERASVASGFPCGLLFTSTVDSHATLSNSGRESLSCHGPFVPPGGGSVHFRGLSCGLFFGGSTTNSKLTWAGDTGDLNLWCKG
jgi:hypothetical protein